MTEHITLAELAEQTGVPARTIRFYIARGLLDGPVKAGRAAAYTAGHVARIEHIKALQEQGRMLSEIGPLLEGANVLPQVSRSAWWQYDVANDVIVLTRGDAPPWRAKQIAAAIEQMANQLKKERE